MDSTIGASRGAGLSRGEGNPSPSSLELKKSAFLQAYALKGSIDGACKATGLDKGQVNRWLRDDKDFSLAKAEAHDLYVDHLEAVLDARINDGGKGADVLLMFKLKKEKPEYREQFKLEHKGLVGVVDLTTEQLEQIVGGCPVAKTGGQGEVLEKNKTIVIGTPQVQSPAAQKG